MLSLGLRSRLMKGTPIIQTHRQEPARSSHCTALHKQRQGQTHRRRDFGFLTASGLIVGGWGGARHVWHCAAAASASAACTWLAAASAPRRAHAGGRGAAVGVRGAAPASHRRSQQDRSSQAGQAGDGASLHVRNRCHDAKRAHKHRRMQSVCGKASTRPPG